MQPKTFLSDQHAAFLFEDTDPAMMQMKTFLKYQCSHYWRRLRWLMPVPVGLLLGYWAGKVLEVLNWQAQLYGETTADVISGNALEAFIWAFGKPEIVYFVATALLIYLVSDFLPAGAYEQSVLLRLRSRGQWWTAKVCLVLLSVLLYAALLFGSFFLAVAPKYPFSAEWSPAGLNNFGVGLGYATNNGTPLQGALWIAIFLWLGSSALGLFILTVNQLTRRSWPGFLCAALIVVSANLGSISGGPIGGQGWESYILIQNHLEYTPLWAPTRMIPEIVSLIFWLVWTLLCVAIGWRSAKRADFLAMEH